MKHYYVSELAERELVEIWDYIAAENKTAADKLMERFFDAFEKLGEMPEMGHRREDLTSRPVRFWSIDRYMVIYKPEPLPIEIVRVVSGWRDLPALLQ